MSSLASSADRWNYLHHHRGITHSIVGVIALAFIVPAIIWLGERIFARLRRTATADAISRIAARFADCDGYPSVDGLDE